MRYQNLRTIRPLLAIGAFTVALASVAPPSVALAEDVPEYTLTLRNHEYQPSEIKVPSGTKFKIIVRNEDASPEEFESTDFGREKIVLPNSSITVFIGPLKAGSYRFFGDFHPDTAKGRLIVE